MTLLALALAGGDLLLAALTLLLWARPEIVVSLLVRGREGGEDEQAEQEARLLEVVRVARWPALLLLAAASYGAGLALVFARV